jgi:hypothetical protein
VSGEVLLNTVVCVGEHHYFCFADKYPMSATQSGDIAN